MSRALYNIIFNKLDVFIMLLLNTKLHYNYVIFCVFSTYNNIQ